jgi:hypothetical protein
MESKKEFKTFFLEMLIVDIILLPFVFIFLLLWLLSLFFLFFFISLGIIILNGVLTILLITNKISIIKSKSRRISNGTINYDI